MMKNISARKLTHSHSHTHTNCNDTNHKKLCCIMRPEKPIKFNHKKNQKNNLTLNWLRWELWWSFYNTADGPIVGCWWLLSLLPLSWIASDGLSDLWHCCRKKSGDLSSLVPLTTTHHRLITVACCSVFGRMAMKMTKETFSIFP